MRFFGRSNFVVASIGMMLAMGLSLSFVGCSDTNSPREVSESESPRVAADEGSAVDEAAGDVGDGRGSAGAAAARRQSQPEEGEEAAISETPSPVIEPAAASDESEIAAQEAKPGEDPLLVGRKPRETTEGWWRIIFSVEGRNDQYQQDYSAGFVKVGVTDGEKYEVEEVRTNDIVNPAKPTKQSSATDKTVRLFFEFEDNKFDYAGTLDGNVIRGNLQFASPRQILVRLIPVEESEVTDEALEVQKLGTTFGGPEIIGALQSGTDPQSVVNGMREVAKTWRTSPVLFSAYDILMQNAGNFELDRSVVEELATEFEKVGEIWGDRSRQAAKLNTAVDLMFTRYQIDLAREKLQQVREEMPELAKHWSQLLEPAEKVARVEEAWQQIQGGNAQEGLKSLREIVQKEPADSLATYRLAAAEQQHGSKEEATKLYAKLAAQPGGEAGLGGLAREEDFTPPRVAAARLYEEAKGSREGFEEYLLDVYRETVVSFLSDEQRNRGPISGDRTVLVELFTGATCPPCVSADIATEAVEKSFSHADAVVLRYHVHNPGPDPLANPETQERYDYYASDMLGTPTVFVDGEVTAFPVGGGYDRSPEVYQQLAEQVAQVATKAPAAKIELSAAIEGESLRVSANSTGAEKPSDSLKMRIVIAENHISFPAMNGILDHSMVVRSMLSGAEGIAPVDGELKFEESISLTELRDQLRDYLKSFEADASKSYGREFKFDDKPLDLSHLSVVAFLQDDTTHEVLQTAVVPIEQEIQLPPLKADAGGAEDVPGPALAAPAEAAAETEGE